MPGTINLNEKSYQIVQGVDTTTIEEDNLDEIVSDIIIEFVKKHTKIINDVEKGIIPKDALESEIINYIDSNNITLKNESNRKLLIKKVFNYIFGYGIIQELIDDKSISDIKIIGTKCIRKKVLGKRMGTNLKFDREKSLLTYCHYLSIKNGGNLSELTAIQSLTDTKTSKDFLMRINITIPPVAKVPTITIRKLPKMKLTLDELVKLNMINLEMKDYLINGIKSGLNIIYCGKGGSGKTTLMNANIEYIPEDEAVLVLQETEELFTDHPETIIENVKCKCGENDMEYNLRTLTVNGLRQDIDRVFIGEIKGAEAMDFFNAAYTGHIVGTSIHSPNSKAAIPKAIHYMKYSAVDLPEETLREMLSEIDLVIYMNKFKVVEMTEIAGFNYETKQIEYNPIFLYEKGKFKRLNQSCSKVSRKLDNYIGEAVCC